ncbi:glycoside hydrolase family 55 protein [Chryseobacterium sp. WG14]|uniref:glycoside hydrolase family 55 protein n=1 Tax=Chryseobacterium sp. WG14 TaxID=2926909 RepID=UPI00211F00B7|nr:glycoside hydrolase family 55 protein [Chryseobacterium sp. WG14]MCQ9641271.1 glycoside hydrolase family 55 protein [Chryseobacterium sp. WG14]
MNCIELNDPLTGEWTVFLETTETYNGSPITDILCSGFSEMYKKINAKYHRRVLHDSKINVKWFGAVGDGINDEAGYFNKALQFISDIGGGILFVPAGKYKLSHVDCETKKYSNITILAHGAEFIQLVPEKKDRISFPAPIPGDPNRVIYTYGRYRAADGMFVFDAKVTNQKDDSNSIKNIKFIGGTFISNVAQYGFDELLHLVCLHGVSNVTFEYCSFVGFLSDGVAVCRGLREDGVRDAYNKDVNFYKCNFDGVNKDNRQGISIYYCDGFSIDFCNFENICRPNMIGAIDIESDTESTISRRGIISNCSFKDIGGSCGAVTIFLRDYEGTTEKISHLGYIIDNCDFETVLTPLSVIGNNKAMIKTSNYGVVFKNNRCLNMDGIADLRQAYGVLFYNNLFNNVTSDTLTILRNTSGNNITFEKNTFDNFKHPAGLAFDGVAKKINFIENQFYNFSGTFITINDPNGIGRVVGNEFASSAVTVPFPLVTGDSASPEKVIRAIIKDNIYGANISHGNLYFFLNGNNPPTLDTITPNKVMYGESQCLMAGGTMPAGFTGDPSVMVKMSRENLANNYYPHVYQTVYPSPNNNGKIWRRQAINQTIWGDFIEIS